MSSFRYFTVDEANAMIPALEVQFAQVTQLRGRLHRAYAELETMGEAPTPESLARTSGPDDLRRLRGQFRGMVEALSEVLDEIEGAGIAVKDIDSGLCDFLGRVADEDVWLCWRYGEKRIEYYHPLDKGFAARRPIASAQTPDQRVLH